jgi:hypothetical protein
MIQADVFLSLRFSLNYLIFIISSSAGCLRLLLMNQSQQLKDIKRASYSTCTTSTKLLAS